MHRNSLGLRVWEREGGETRPGPVQNESCLVLRPPNVHKPPWPSVLCRYAGFPGRKKASSHLWSGPCSNALHLKTRLWGRRKPTVLHFPGADGSSPEFHLRCRCPRRWKPAAPSAGCVPGCGRRALAPREPHLALAAAPNALGGRGSRLGPVAVPGVQRAQGHAPTSPHVALEQVGTGSARGSLRASQPGGLLGGGMHGETPFFQGNQTLAMVTHAGGSSWCGLCLLQPQM